MRVFSAFSGIGGFDLAMANVCDTVRKPNECVIVGCSEVDKHAISVYERHFSGVPNFGDITKIDEKQLPDFDCLVGGIPCQSWSTVGKRGGFDDSRGNLWWDFIRILSEKKPQYFIAENVKGLLSHDKGASFNRLCEEFKTAGYAISYKTLNSKNFGVPQSRERVIIVGSRNSTLSLENLEQTEPVEISSILDKEPSSDLFVDNERNAELLSTLADKSQPIVYDDYNSNWRKDRISGTMTTNIGSKAKRNGQKVFDGIRVRRFSPVECEKLHSFPKDWTKYGKDNTLISNSQRYKMCGNAVTTNVVQAVYERIFYGAGQ